MTQFFIINLSGSKYLLSVSISKLLKNFGIFSVHNFGCACHQNLIQEKMYFETYFTMITSVFYYFSQGSA